MECMVADEACVLFDQNITSAGDTAPVPASDSLAGLERKLLSRAVCTLDQFREEWHRVINRAFATATEQNVETTLQSVSYH